MQNLSLIHQVLDRSSNVFDRYFRISGAVGVRFTPAEVSELNSAVRAIEVKGQRGRLADGTETMDRADSRNRLPDAVLAFSGVEAPMKK